MAVKKKKPKPAARAAKPVKKTVPASPQKAVGKPQAAGKQAATKPVAAKVKSAPVKASPAPVARPSAPASREEAMRSAAKVAQALAGKKASITEQPKKDLKPVDPKDAARAIRQIKASVFSTLATSSAPSAVTSSTASSLPPRVQALLDRSEIEELMIAYARGIDRAEENLVRSVFHPDATVDFGPGIFQGAVIDFITWAMDVRAGMKAAQHYITNIRVDLRGDAAFAESYFLAWHRLDKPTGKEDFFLGGRYLDRLERRPAGAAGVWKIAHRKQVKDWTRTTPVAELFYHLNPDALWAPAGKQDPSYHMDAFPSGKSGRAPAYLGRRYDAKSMKV